MRSRLSTHRLALPLAPLLHAYTAAGLPSIAELHRLPGLGSRFAAILAATARFLYADFLDRASEEQHRDNLLRFHEAVVPYPLHTQTLSRRAGFLRHGLGHLLHGRESPPRKLAACLSATGAYRVPGLGPGFWSALLQGTVPARYPAWTPLTHSGLVRSGIVRLERGAGPASVYAGLQEAHAAIRASRPELTTLHADHFLSLVSAMSGRDVHSGASALAACPVSQALQKLRERMPSRQRLKTRGQELAQGQSLLAQGLAAGCGKTLAEALTLADPHGASRCQLDWTRHGPTLTTWIERIWKSDDPAAGIAHYLQADPLPLAGSWLPASVLHLRDPQRFSPFNDLVTRGLAVIDDGIDPADPVAERYRLLNEACDWLRQRFNLHPLETPELLATLASADEAHSSFPIRNDPFPLPDPGEFHGFCPDTFAFLTELARENSRDWMDGQRQRYQFVVRAPLLELCQALARRYVEPILGGVHGWHLDTQARAGRALTSICKNVFGKSLPYTSTLWITFCQKGQSRAGVQLFVCLSPGGLRYGLRLGRTAREARDRLRRAVASHGEVLYRLLCESSHPDPLLFGQADLPGQQRPLQSVACLKNWAVGRTQEVSIQRDGGDGPVQSPLLLDDVILTFDRLLPLYACCVSDDPSAFLSPSETDSPTAPAPGQVHRPYGAREFSQHTFLDDDWLSRALDLLALKKQLILQGVPGTGKTHVARCLARLLTNGCDEAVRLVQFHPAYSYEEFVEGIRVRSVNVDGRHDVSYPVEDGLLCAFASRAASRPHQPHVLIIDEINRGNLPRIFGELLYLLEYRGQAALLPCSRRSFQLPENLYFLGTMNPADRSISPVDQALRRRFSFLRMEPDARVLAQWLNEQRPSPGPAFMARVVGLFERLNSRLDSDLGPQARVGHSYFMVPGLNEARLQMIWQHHIGPLLDELFAGQPGRAAAYQQLLQTEKPRTRRPETVESS